MKKCNKKIFLLGGIGLVVIIILIFVIINIFFGRRGVSSMDGAAKQFVKALECKDLKNYIAVCVLDADRKGYKEFKYYLEEYCGFDEDDKKNAKIKYFEIVKQEETKTKDITSYEEYFFRVCDLDVEIEKSYEIEVEYTTETVRDEYYSSEVMTVIKVDGKWYVLDAFYY